MRRGAGRRGRLFWGGVARDATRPRLSSNQPHSRRPLAPDRAMADAARTSLPRRSERHAAHVEGLAEVRLAGRAVTAFTLSASGACKCGAGGGEAHSVQVRGGRGRRRRSGVGFRAARALRAHPPAAATPSTPPRPPPFGGVGARTGFKCDGSVAGARHRRGAPPNAARPRAHHSRPTPPPPPPGPRPHLCRRRRPPGCRLRHGRRPPAGAVVRAGGGAGRGRAPPSAPPIACRGRRRPDPARPRGGRVEEGV